MSVRTGASVFWLDACEPRIGAEPASSRVLGPEGVGADKQIPLGVQTKVDVEAALQLHSSTVGSPSAVFIKRIPDWNPVSMVRARAPT
jgi:hypothetical protein